MTIEKLIKVEKINYLLIAVFVVIAKIILIIYPSDHPMAGQDLLGWSSIGIILAIGFLTLHLAKKAGFYDNRDKATIKKGITISMVLGLVTGLLIIIMSLFLKFPNIHIPLPHSVPVYFIAGSLLEFKLHLIPLVLGTWLLSSIFFKINFNNKVFFIVVFLVSIYEPFNQVVGLTSAGLVSELWVQILLFIFILFTNIIPLILFKKYGFMSFILYRFTDYTVWHIIWPLIYFSN